MADLPDNRFAADWERIELWLAGAGILDIPDEPDDMSQFHVTVVCPDGGLRTTLERIDRRPEWLADRVLTLFLHIAARADELIGYDDRGGPWLLPLPINLAPAHFLPAYRALETSGLCRISRSGMLHWGDGILGAITEAGVLVDGVSLLERRRQALCDLWKSMPKRLKALVVTEEGDLNVVALALAIGTYRRDVQWRLSAPAGVKEAMPVDMQTAKALNWLDQEGLLSGRKRCALIGMISSISRPDRKA